MIDRFNVWHHKKEDSKKSTPWKQAGKGDQDEQEAVSDGQLFQQYQPQPYTYNLQQLDPLKHDKLLQHAATM